MWCGVKESSSVLQIEASQMEQKHAPRSINWHDASCK